MSANVRTTALVAALAGLGVIAAPAQALAPSGGTITQITAPHGRAGRELGNVPRVRWSATTADTSVRVLLAQHRRGRQQRPDRRFPARHHDRSHHARQPQRPGRVGNNDSSIPAISANGKYVSFHSEATDLAGAPTPAVTAVADLPLQRRHRPHQARLEDPERRSLPTSGVPWRHQCDRPLHRLHLTGAQHRPRRPQRRGGRVPLRLHHRHDDQGEPAPRRPGDRQVLLRRRHQRQRPVHRVDDQAANMGPADTNNDEDAYVFDAETGTTTLSATTPAARPSAADPPASATTARSSRSPRAPTRSRPETPTTRRRLRLQRRHRLGEADQRPVPEGAGVAPSPPPSPPTAGTSPSSASRWPIRPTRHVYLYDRQTRQSMALCVKPAGSAAN